MGAFYADLGRRKEGFRESFLELGGVGVAFSSY